MRLHRFFIETDTFETEEISVTNETLLNQWRNVLRIKEGGNVVLFDGNGYEVLCAFVSLTKKNAVLRVLERKAGLVPQREVTLYIALIKKDNFELAIEKATELGVSHIVPVDCARSEKKGLNYERARKILREASEQSGRVTVPTLGEIISVKEIPCEGLVVFDPRTKILAREYFNARHATHSVLIGTEGGFTDGEIALFHARNIPIVTTGTQILRAETAVIVALAFALFV